MSSQLHALAGELAKPVACGWLSRGAAERTLLAACLKADREGGLEGRDPGAVKDFLIWLLEERMRPIRVACELLAYRIEQCCWRRGKEGEPRIDILEEARELNRVGGGYFTPVQIAALVADTLEAVGRWQRKQERPMGDGRDVTP